uniref:Transmembrane protein n=1 Tax=Globodera rostochiensis TaxID=31243 RepID=A0A914I7Y9_GLORO
MSVGPSTNGQSNRTPIETLPSARSLLINTSVTTIINHPRLPSVRSFVDHPSKNFHDHHNTSTDHPTELLPSRSLFLWLGMAYLLLALLLLGVDALSNVLTESRFSVSSALAAVLCSVFAFIVARSRSEDRASRWLLLLSCLTCTILCSLLFLESGHGLMIISRPSGNGSNSSAPSQCPALSTAKDIAMMLSLRSEDEQLLRFRPCLAPVLLSMLFCAALIGISLSLCLLVMSTRPVLLQQRYQRPFSALIGRRRSRRRTVTKLPLLASTVPQTATANGHLPDSKMRQKQISSCSCLILRRPPPSPAAQSPAPT